MSQENLVENPVYERNLEDDLFRQTFLLLKNCYDKIETAKKENKSIGSYGEWLIDICYEIANDFKK